MSERLKWLLATLAGWEDNYRIPDALMSDFRMVRTEVADMAREAAGEVAPAPAAPAPAQVPSAPAPSPEDMALSDRVTALEHMVEALVSEHLSSAPAAEGVAA